MRLFENAVSDTQLHITHAILLKVGQMYWSERCDGDISSYCVSGVSDFEIVEIGVILL